MTAWIPALAAFLAAGPLPAAGTGEASEDLLWPTDAGRCVTSTLCEYRSGHFHSGIDISTNGRTGFRVFAVGDGDIVRVRVGCKGYGKALYLRLADGRTVVYAHLDRFEGAIADTARAIGRRTGSAYFDREYPPGVFPVDRGDVVARSGETGIGVPHLHVEVRDASERPLDPLRAGLHAPDGRPPHIRRLAITPLGAGSCADGRADTAILDVVGGRVERTVPVEGVVGLAIDVADAKDGCRYDLAPAAIGLREDGRTVTEIRYDGFSFDETGLVDFQIDPRFRDPGRGRFHNLYRRPGWALPFAADGNPDAGYLRGTAAGEECRTLELFARDSQGNEVTATIELSFAAPPALEGMTAGWAVADPGGAAADSLVVSGTATAGGRELSHVRIDVSTDLGATWMDTGRVVPASDGSFRWVGSAPRRAPLIVRARPLDRLGVEGLARSAGVGPAPETVLAPRAEVVTHGSFWEVRLDGAVGAIAADSAAGSLVRGAAGEARILLPGRVGPLDERRRVVAIADPWGRAAPVEVEPPPIARPGEETRIRAAEGRARVSFLPGTVRETTAVLVREVAPPPHAPEELVPLGPRIAVDVGSVPLASDFELRLTPGRMPTGTGRVAVFAQDGRAFRYIGGREEPDGSGWVVRARTASPLGLFEDRVPPRLGSPHLTTADGRLRVVFAVREGGSGLDCDGIEVLLEGRPVPHELDEERGEVVGYPEAGGAFEIRATDRCGNAARWTGTLGVP